MQKRIESSGDKSARLADYFANAPDSHASVAINVPEQRALVVAALRAASVKDGEVMREAFKRYPDGEAPWTEDEQFEERAKACRSRCRKYGYVCDGSEDADRLVNCDDLVFEAELERRFGLKLGEIKVETKPRAWPLGPRGRQSGGRPQRRQ